jgi:hypothetical protein
MRRITPLSVNIAVSGRHLIIQYFKGLLYALSCDCLGIVHPLNGMQLSVIPQYAATASNSPFASIG